jgi:two-component system chemotaxis response regulator CheB
MTEKIKVLIVDDSAIVRSMLSESLEKQDDIEVVGTAPDPFIARDKIVRLKPDVITLDIEMPRMDGLTFLKKLMIYYPMPVIIVSSVTASDTYASIKALELGAFDVVNKPGGSITIKDVIDEVTMKIRRAYDVRDKFVNKFKQVEKRVSGAKKSAVSSDMLKSIKTTEKLIAIGASTGGTVALEYLMKQLSGNLPPILIVQHMPPGFTGQFSRRLNELSEIQIQEAEDNEILINGTVYIAPGGHHLGIKRKGASVYTQIIDTERVHFQKPAVDVLFNSVAEIAGRNALGILLTGMGKDGAQGLKTMLQNGASTVAQDEKSSIVWGMPKAAIDMGAAQKVLSLEEIPELIYKFAAGK